MIDNVERRAPGLNRLRLYNDPRHALVQFLQRAPSYPERARSAALARLRLPSVIGCRRDGDGRPLGRTSDVGRRFERLARYDAVDVCARVGTTVSLCTPTVEW